MRQTVTCLAILLLAQTICAAPARSAVIVIANRSHDKVNFTISVPGEPARSMSLWSGEVRPIRVADSAEARFTSLGAEQQFALDPNSIYYFASDRSGKLELARIGLGQQDMAPPAVMASTAPVTGSTAPATAPAPGAAKTKNQRKPSPLTVIPVKILVDEEERMRREIWEKRLRDRVDAASNILEAHCFVRFKVVAVDTWQSDNNITDFVRSLGEFEQKVDPGPARLAIGFTSQYTIARGKTHLGGTRGPLHSHLLVREWSKYISEAERLEVLLHELGHYLGAVHSPERDSVMRPMLGDKQARVKAFRIGFDPVNTLAMCLVSEELHVRPLRSVTELSMATQLELHKIYAEMARALPDDPAAPRYMEFVDRARLTPLGIAARVVVDTIVEAGARNSQLPRKSQASPGSPVRLTKDELAELYFRQAAAAAQRFPADIGQQAYLIGLAITLDKTNVLREHPLVGPVCRLVESDEDRLRRLAVLGEPTMRGRDDLLAHFAISAALASLAGSLPAESIGLLKERQDADGGSGFSFVDYQADLAGIIFATQLKGAKLTLGELARGFACARFLPDEGDLVEGLSWAEFTKRFGSLLDKRFLDARAEINRRILALPAYEGKR